MFDPRAREGSVRTKQRKSQAGRLNSSGKPATRQTTYDSTEMSSMASTSNGSFNSIRAEQKYQKKTRAKQQQGCDCGPLLDKIGKTIQRDRSGHWLWLFTFLLFTILYFAGRTSFPRLTRTTKRSKAGWRLSRRKPKTKCSISTRTWKNVLRKSGTTARSGWRDGSWKTT